MPFSKPIVKEQLIARVFGIMIVVVAGSGPCFSLTRAVDLSRYGDDDRGIGSRDSERDDRSVQS